jgi:hypothetical protein
MLIRADGLRIVVGEQSFVRVVAKPAVKESSVWLIALSLLAIFQRVLAFVIAVTLLDRQPRIDELVFDGGSGGSGAVIAEVGNRGEAVKLYGSLCALQLVRLPPVCLPSLIGPAPVIWRGPMVLNGWISLISLEAGGGEGGQRGGLVARFVMGDALSQGVFLGGESAKLVGFDGLAMHIYN